MNGWGLDFTCREPGTAFWIGWSSSYIEGYTKATSISKSECYKLFGDPWLNSDCSTPWPWFNTNQSWISFESYQSFWFNFNSLLNTIRCSFQRSPLNSPTTSVKALRSYWSGRWWRKRVINPEKRTLLTEFGCKLPHIFLESSITIALTVNVASPKFIAFYRVFTREKSTDIPDLLRL